MNIVQILCYTFFYFSVCRWFGFSLRLLKRFGSSCTCVRERASNRLSGHCCHHNRGDLAAVPRSYFPRISLRSWGSPRAANIQRGIGFSSASFSHSALNDNTYRTPTLSNLLHSYCISFLFCAKNRHKFFWYK